jgi:hypothetical protein
MVTELATEAEFTAFGQRVKALVLARDIKGLKKYMKFGAQGPNDAYSREQAFRMMDDPSNWLHRRFFDGPWSLAAFFAKHPDAVVDQGGACDYYSLSYASADGREAWGCNILAFKHKGRFYLWEFSVCPAYSDGTRKQALPVALRHGILLMMPNG